VDLGYNYRIDEIRAAIGLTQLGKVERNNQRRRELSQLYREALQELAPQVSVPFEQHQGTTSAHIMPVLLPPGTNRVGFMECMKEHGIQTSIHYPPIHTFTSYRDDRTWQLPVTDEVAAREVTLPLYPMLSNEDVLEVVKAVKESLS
jgi:dTDP-4-amino-4,6-dideoxygalactose transaminase